MRLWDPISGKHVYFDDCRLSDGAMIDAKGTGYADMLRNLDRYPWLGVEAKFFKQAQQQLRAAGARRVEWHFAEASVAAHVSARFTKEAVRIIVVHSPPPWARQ